MDGTSLLGRQLTVVFAEENRKKPTDMRGRDRPKGRNYDRRRSPPRHSRSPPPRYEISRSRSRGHYSPPPKRRQYSRSGSPQEEKRYSRERSYSHSPPGYKSPIQERSPPPYNNNNNGRRGRSPPVRGQPSRTPSRSHSPAQYSPKRDVSPSP